MGPSLDSALTTPEGPSHACPQLSSKSPLAYLHSQSLLVGIDVEVASTQTFNHYQTSTTHSLPRKRLCGTCQDLNEVLRQHHSFNNPSTTV